MSAMQEFNLGPEMKTFNNIRWVVKVSVHARPFNPFSLWFLSSPMGIAMYILNEGGKPLVEFNSLSLPFVPKTLTHFTRE